jgi:hypothetical protein
VIVLKRKNRRIGATIALRDNRDIEFGQTYIPDTWELECWSHGFMQSFETKRLALSAMAHSDEWCKGCIQGWPIDIERANVYSRLSKQKQFYDDEPALPASQREGGAE